jgi:hypothetical protein
MGGQVPLPAPFSRTADHLIHRRHHAAPLVDQSARS